MTITLYYNPQSRAAGTVWLLEELGQPYELSHIDFQKGENRTPEFLAINPMGKLPTLVHDGVVLTENAAIALYLGDRYSLGQLAPPLESAERATYLRWILYGPSVIEPGCSAKASGWEFSSVAAGWGTYDTMLDTISAAIGDNPFLLGEKFSIADVIFGGTVRFMLQFKMLEPRPEYQQYIERLNARPAYQRASEINTKAMQKN